MRRRRRNPSLATWIALAAGGLVGYGIYRAMTTSGATSAQNLQAANQSIANQLAAKGLSQDQINQLMMNPTKAA